MIGSKKTAVHMPPGSSSTVDSASDGPDSRMSQSWPETRRVVWLGDRMTASYGGLPVAHIGRSPHLSCTRSARCSRDLSAGSTALPRRAAAPIPRPLPGISERPNVNSVETCSRHQLGHRDPSPAPVSLRADSTPGHRRRSTTARSAGVRSPTLYEQRLVTRRALRLAICESLGIVPKRSPFVCKQA